MTRDPSARSKLAWVKGRPDLLGRRPPGVVVVVPEVDPQRDFLDRVAGIGAQGCAGALAQQGDVWHSRPDRPARTHTLCRH